MEKNFYKIINISIKKINIKIINKIIILLFLIYFFIYFLIKKKYNKLNNLIIEKNYCRKNNIKKLISNKWIVITTINSPSQLIFNLLKIADNWKIVVIGDIKTNDEEWKIFKLSNKLVYLSIEDQLNLCYDVTKYIPFNSYTRKNIGYLYAIENGAKEIYEINDNINIKNLNDFNKIFRNNDTYSRLCLTKSNNTKMINPYYYFGLRNIWPRGFRLGDISKDDNFEFINVILSQTKVKPLIYQGLINGEPDLDSIFLLTRIEKNSSINISFSYNYPLIYLPGNYIPINSKNTKYLYDVFPALPLLTTVNKKISDIWRGFIMQRYIWGYNGVVLFHFSKSYKNSSFFFNNSEFAKENNLHFKLDNFLHILKNNLNNDLSNPKDFLINILENLVNYEIIEKDDLNMYKAFIQDLSNIGYIYKSKYTTKLNYNYKNYLNIKSEIITNTRFQYKIILNNNRQPNNLKLFCHKLSKIIFNDILLVINYNYHFLLKLNNYMIHLYNKNFPHIVFINPSNVTNNNDNIISCPESYKGYYAYMCFRKIYNKYPNMKGYLIIDDDNFLKTWNLDNIDYNIPFLNIFQFHRWKQFLYNSSQISKLFIKTYKNLNNTFYKNLEWKNNITQLLGFYAIPKSLVDNIYFPNSIFNRFIELVEQMYKKRVFLEMAIPCALGIMLLPKYKITSNLAIWANNRKNIIKYLKTNNDKTFIHPIKFSKKNYWEEVNSYIYFINAEEF